MVFELERKRFALQFLSGREFIVNNMNGSTRRDKCEVVNGALTKCEVVNGVNGLRKTQEHIFLFSLLTLPIQRSGSLCLLEQPRRIYRRGQKQISKKQLQQQNKINFISNYGISLEFGPILTAYKMSVSR